MSFQILQGDALALLRTLPDESVNCCVTSPPYWGLRDYGTAKWEGGEPSCDHKKVSPGTASLGKSTLGPNRDGVSGQKTNGHQQEGFMSNCGKCGASRVDEQLGLEATPEEYATRITAIFREVRRVLRNDGTLWLNLGDSYTSGGRVAYDSTARRRPTDAESERESHPSAGKGRAETPVGMKAKDLVGIPWMAAFALRLDGWWLRSEIIWHKPNPMPESVTDRPTKAHEQIFLLAKSEKYYYDAGSIAEPAVYAGDERHLRADNTQGARELKQDQVGNRRYTGFNARYFGTRLTSGSPVGETRNKRTVWTVTTKPFPGSHFATFPPDLIDPCILAGCPEGGTVLDPFSGAGTTGVVALRRGRNYIGLELNPEYVAMSRKRILEDSPLWNSEVSA